MIKLIKPYITFQEVEEDFKRIFESGTFTKGEYVNKFLQEIKTYLGVDHAFLTTSATTALTMCLKSLGIGLGDEVIVSDFSFPATVNVVEDIGAMPIFADVDQDTFNMKSEELERKITQKTKAVIFVDAFGNPSGISKIKGICEEHQIPLIEDAACAIGSSENGVNVGKIADLTCFSFHPRKLLTTGEGGVITTNKKEIAEIMSVKLNHGAIVRDGMADFINYGYNYRLSELQAAMGIKQLNKLESIVKSRNSIADEYKKRLHLLGFKRQNSLDNVIHNIQSLVFMVPEGMNRDHLIAYLTENGIESTIGTYCLSNTTYYKNKYNSVQPIAKYLEKNTVTLPCYDNVDHKYISNIIEKYVRTLED
ncbi:DegT/DnrJ/EryC1/StrS family aminotransferase [Paenibacillus sonchi]|uniref:DegT/DnrJ/EryC1/StrS family aminotransferase n=1 Tax=Paenibacillus sonchi TaxID=373687 RepID=A0A974SDU4_9BACL|nr:DegT/DnrJ/EryC1/StrS family aminotransferase [Paenibacillus sonchi]QQZ62818.1 DegT/DnrJ/EryC1/StrS family aminotransferase [Paenibacillus sonchi]